MANNEKEKNFFKFSNSKSKIFFLFKTLIFKMCFLQNGDSNQCSSGLSRWHWVFLSFANLTFSLVFEKKFFLFLSKKLKCKTSTAAHVLRQDFFFTCWTCASGKNFFCKRFELVEMKNPSFALFFTLQVYGSEPSSKNRQKIFSFLDINLKKNSNSEFAKQKNIEHRESRLLI